VYSKNFKISSRSRVKYPAGLDLIDGKVTDKNNEKSLLESFYFLSIYGAIQLGRYQVGNSDGKFIFSAILIRHFS
jgi:hypothetical protein